MTLSELNNKQLRERSALEQKQWKELNDLSIRHQVEAQTDMSDKAQALRNSAEKELLTRHKLERDNLFSSHEREYDLYRKNREIIRDAEVNSNINDEELKKKQEEQKKKDLEKILEKNKDKQK